MSSPWIFISPSSRGIGHALTRHLLKTTSLPILASTRSRDPSSTKDSLLKDLSSSTRKNDYSSRLHMVHMDVTSEETVKQAAQEAQSIFPSDKHHLHLACAIPGILHPEKSPSQINYDHALETFKVNTLGPMLLIKHFSPFLPQKATNIERREETETTTTKKEGEEEEYYDELSLPSQAVWLNMAARVGSITDNRAGGWFSYRASKTGVMSVTRSFDIWLNGRVGDKAMAVGYHPGTVKTDLSKEFWGSTKNDQLFEVDDAVAKMAKVIAGLKNDMRGKTYDWKSEEVHP